MERRALLIGIVSTLAGATLWGFSGSCVQFLFGATEIDSTFITMVRMLGAGLLFLVILLLRSRELLRQIIHDKQSLLRLAVFGFGLYFCQLTYIGAIGFTNAGTATVLQSLNIAIILILTCLFVHRLPYLLELGGLVCALLATLLISTKGNFTSLELPLPGLVWGLLAAATAAFYTMYPRRLFERWPSYSVTGIGMLVGGVFSIVFWLLTGAIGPLGNLVGGSHLVMPELDARCIVVLVLVVVLGTFGSYGLFLHGVSLIGSVRGSQLGAVEPVSATVFSCIWLNTAFGWHDWLGLVLMVATTLLVTLQNSPKHPRQRMKGGS